MKYLQTTIYFAIWATAFVLFFLITGCRTVKKEWVKENFAEKSELQTTQNIWTEFVQNSETNITESLKSFFDERIKSVKENTTSNENENTDISVNIKAEDGKEKSATVGNTTITSNGADITVKTSSTKVLSSQLETINKELTQTITKLETSLKTLENKFNEKIDAQNSVIEKLKSELNVKSKETKKTGMSFWFTFSLIILGILVLLWFFGDKIPIVRKIKAIL